jgi:hypothetical protein
VAEAGRSPEPPLMALPGRDAEQDGLIEDTAPPSGLMSAPSRPTSSRPGTEGSKANGKKRPDPDPESSAQPSASSDVPFPADGIHTPDRGGDRDRGGERASASGAALSGKLDSGRQAVRQAVAATNNWIVGRTAKSDSSAPPKDNADRSGASGTEASGAEAFGARAFGAGASADVVPEAEGVADPSSGPATVVSSVAAGAVTASSETVAAGTASSAESVFSPDKSRPSVTPAAPAEAASANGPGKQEGTSTGRSLWRDSRPSAQPVSERQPSAAAQSSVAAQQPSYSPPRSSAGWSSTPAQPSAAVPVPNRGPSAKWRREAARRSRRQAHLTLARVEPWSVMKFSFVVSVVAFVILFVAIAVLYMVLSGLGVFTSLQHTVSTITSSQGSSGTNISHWFTASRILGYTAMLGAFNIILITAMSTIGAVVYNLIAQTVGGVEITLRETE